MFTIHGRVNVFYVCAAHERELELDFSIDDIIDIINIIIVSVEVKRPSKVNAFLLSLSQRTMKSLKF